MHSLYPMADYQFEVARRQEEMAEAQKSLLARECLECKKSDLNLPLRLLNFLLLLIPIFKR